MPYKDPEKKRAYAREWIAKRKVAWFDTNGPCVKCGSLERLELDHVNPADKISHCVWSWSKERREVELAKCQVLCYKCHLEKSNNEKAVGERVYSVKLTSKDVKEMRLLHESHPNGTLGYKPIARMYNVNRNTARSAIRGETWKHI